jgi:biofilm PGA synthesis N-glycosyltransferase PgaC
LYPLVTSALWIAGGVLFRLFDEQNAGPEPAGGWPGVTVLIPAYNEAAVVAACVTAARAVDYPVLEILVLDDGSADRTAEVAAAAATGDARVEVIRDSTNKGKAERLNAGFARARHDLVTVIDADTHLHPSAIKLLVARISRSHKVAAVAGAAHVTNRTNLLCAMQIIEAASIIGLIRRTQAVAGRVGVVAGVLGLFRKEAVLGVGGYRGEMATEDIDLSWRLLLAGWHTTYEPAALVGMEVPARMPALWAQRRRWSRGQGEVLHVHVRDVARFRNRRLWPLALEAIASLAWVVCLIGLTAALAIQLVLPLANVNVSFVSVGLAWGVALAVVASVQLSVALGIDFIYDRRATLAFLVGPLYPIAYWTISAAAAACAELPAIFHGPSEARVVWNIPREALDQADSLHSSS